MNKDLTLTNKGFNAFLDWLSPDREEAGKEYERIRLGLVKYFRIRGCDDCDTLTDQTINRVISKLHTYDLSKDISKLAIFHSFAKHIFLEFIKEEKKSELFKEKHLMFKSNSFPNENEKSDKLLCFERCLSELEAEDRSLIIDYYEKEKKEKIKIRKELATRFNVNSNALHLRVFRVKNELKLCIKNCLAKKSV